MEGREWSVWMEGVDGGAPPLHVVRERHRERAERLSYLNCAVLRASIERNLDSDEGPFAIDDRICGEVVELSREDFDDLVRMHLCDWLEQAERWGQWGYRREAFVSMARRLGEIAQEKYDAVFAREPQKEGV